MFEALFHNLRPMDQGLKSNLLKKKKVMMCSLTYPEKNKKQIFTTDAKIKAAVVRGGDNLSPRIDQSYIRATD